MASYYVDSSALVKRHAQELGSAWFARLADPAAGNVIVTSRLSLVEVYSALNRRVREGSISPVQYTQISTDFTALCTTEYELIELDHTVVERARILLEQWPLRANDAVQLGSALVLKDALRSATAVLADDPIFLAADDRLLQFAEKEGLSTDNPNRHS